MSDAQVTKLKLNNRALGGVLKSASFRARMNAAAASIAGSAGDDAKIESYTTDRASAAVKVPAAAQARDGALTRAAASAGLQVRAR